LTAQRFAAILCASLAVAAALRLGAHKHQIYLSKHLAAPDVRQEAVKKPRKIYSYSVIPGGAYSREELALALKVDPVAAAHYSDFEASNTSVHPLPQDTYVYVSYRKADHVYWTANKHRVPKGELVLSDGKHLARTRCGNRLSGIPEFPIAHGPQPSELALNAPELPPGIELPQAPLFPPQYDAPVMPLAGTLPREFAFPLGTPGSSPIPDAFPALAFPSPYTTLGALPAASLTGAPTKGPGPVPITPIPSGTVPGGITPEPGSATLLALGGALLAAFLAAFRKRCRQ
jgi:hypothetical protein